MMVQNQITELFNELLNQTARLRKGGCQAVYFCPCCKHHKRKLEINLETGQWHCWTCDIKGAFLGSFLRKLHAPEAYRERLAKITGDLRLIRKSKKKVTGELSLPREFHPLTKPKNNPEYRNAVAFLKRRGLCKEDFARYNIGYCEEGEYAYHVIIPSYDANGKLNFFVGRRYYDVEKTIPHKKPVEASMNVVGFESFINYNEPIILVEAALNAITIRRNAIPLFGKYPSKYLLEKLIINNVKDVYVFLDSDASKDAFKVCKRLLAIGITPRIVRLDKGKDANEVGFVKSWNCIKKAKPFDFLSLVKSEMGI